MGEAMLELSQTPDGQTRLGYGGDTLNTAVYLARLGQRVSYITAMGADPYSDDLLARWQQEGIDTEFVARHPARMPGLYAIKTDAHGERSFFYWRDNSSAQAFFDLPEAKPALEKLKTSRWMYLSGLTLSLFDAQNRAKLVEVAAHIVANGGDVVFDMNYRPKRWLDRNTAQNAALSFAQYATIIMPTRDDDDLLFGKASEEEHVARWLTGATRLVVVKNGPEGCRMYQPDQAPLTIKPEASIKPVDTTGAGDSFNAGFISGLMDGVSLTDAAAAGNRLAGIVIQHRGAIIDRALHL